MMSLGELRLRIYRKTLRRLFVRYWRFIYDEHKRLCGQPLMSNGKPAPRP